VTAASNVELRLPGLLADDVGGQTVHHVDAAGIRTVADVLDAVDATWPKLGRRLRDETGTLRRHVNVYIGQDDIRWADGLATAVHSGDVVLILPSVAGG
jgi:molybdopterin converting factor small subunit